MSMYWEKRAEKILIDRERDTELYIDKIEYIYKNTQNQIDLEIQKIYNKFADDGKLTKVEATKILNSTETKEHRDNLLKQINSVQNNDAKRILLNKYNASAYNYRISRLEALKTDIYVKCKVLADKELEYSTQNYTNTIKNTYCDYTQAISNYKTSQNITFSNINNNVLNKILTTNWLGSNFSKRIWGNTEILAKNVNNTLQKGILAGLSNQKMSKELNDVMQTGKFNATRLIRTETNHFHNQAELQSYKDDGIIYYRFSAYLDNRTSEVCKDLDNKIFKVESARTGNNYPPMHPFCRSTTLPVFEDELELTDEEKDTIKDYTGFNATKINKALRTNNITPLIQEKINILDSAINKSHPLEEDIILYRGGIIQNFVGFENSINVSHKVIMNLSETIIKDRAFISTSKSKPEEQGRNIIMRIKLPKAFDGALSIKDYAVDKYKYQDEVLLKRDTNFFVTKTNYKDGKYYFDMEVLEWKEK